MYSTCLAASVAILVAASVNPASAIVVKGNPSQFPDSLVEEFARLAAPLVVIVQPGQMVEEAVVARCGNLSAVYRKVLHARFQELNPESSLRTPVEMGGNLPEVVKIPFCFESASSESLSIRLKDKDSLWRFYTGREAQVDAVDPTSGELSPAILENPPEQAFQWPEYQAAFEQANPGVNPDEISAGNIVNLPTAAPAEEGLRFYSVQLETNSREAARELAAKVDAEPTAVAVADSPFGELEGSLASSALDALGEDCGLSEAPLADLRGALGEALEVLVLNDAVRAQNDTIGKRSSATVLVADTGLVEYGRPPFSRSLVAIDRDKGSIAGKAFDANPDHRHGTYVGSVAVGGPDFVWVNALMDYPVKLAFVHVDEPRQFGDETRYVVSMERLTDVGLRLEQDKSISVVNMSLRFGAPTNAFRDAYVSGNEQVLFVVSAGNAGKKLSATGSWPALYGGEDDGNVVTVAASNWSGALAKFSNHDPDYVDLAAPGCMVTAYAYDPAKERFISEPQSGTSIAAPLVSFTAAMMKAEMPDLTALDVKWRILDSADFAPEKLSTFVKGSRSLNMARALAIFADQIELSDGRVIRGKVVLDGDAAKTLLCPSGVDLGKGEYRRIAKMPGDVASMYVGYVKDMLGDQDRHKDYTCTLDQISTRLEIEPWPSETPVPIDWKDVQNVMFATRGFWVN